MFRYFFRALVGVNDMHVNDQFKLFAERFVEEFVEPEWFKTVNSHVLQLYIHLWKCGPKVAGCLKKNLEEIFANLLPSNEMLTFTANHTEEAISDNM